MSNIQKIQKTSDVKINKIMVVSATSVVADITNFVLQLNVYEDIFKTGLYGTIMVMDSVNLPAKLPFVGCEYIHIDFQTPTMEQRIEKTFAVYAISDRQAVTDTNTQAYLLHFCSVEVMRDSIQPLSMAFSGTIEEIVGRLYQDYVATTRSFKFINDEKAVKVDYEGDTSSLMLIDCPTNIVKFVSPYWTPMKCLTWLAAKSMSPDGQGANYMFYETNKAFYFTSINSLLSRTHESKYYAGRYTYSPTNSLTKHVDTPEGAYTTPDLNARYFNIIDYHITNDFNTLDKTQDGHLASTLVSFDLVNKKHEYLFYDYLNPEPTERSYGRYIKKNFYTSEHTNPMAVPQIPIAIYSPDSHVMYQTKHPSLFDNVPNNINEYAEEMKQHRLAQMFNLSNTKINLTIPGRSDLEVGMVIEVQIPDTSKKSSDGKQHLDITKSGFYLITAINHQVTLDSYHCIIEAVSDSTRIYNNA